MSPLATVGIRTPATSRERRGLGEGAGRRGPSHGGSWVRARSAPSHIWTTPPPPKSGRSPLHGHIWAPPPTRFSPSKPRTTSGLLWWRGGGVQSGSTHRVYPPQGSSSCFLLQFCVPGAPLATSLPQKIKNNNPKHLDGDAAACTAARANSATPGSALPSPCYNH